MRKAFDQNVSRAKPRLRLGAAFTETQPAGEASATAPAEAVPEASAAPTAAEALGAELKARVEQRVRPADPVRTAEPPARASLEPPAELREIQNPPPPPPAKEGDHLVRREKLKARLKAARENPRPEPLPATVAQAGVLAVERIAALQKELSEVKALNLALTQDLEAARRQAERATEEARLRMDEAHRLASEMEGRNNLLKDLERELSSLEAERDEVLLSLQESRQELKASGEARATLQAELAKKEQALSESLSEEERLAGELEAAHEDSRSMSKAVEALRSERDVLARQVAELTRERTELLDARKALEAVHRALSNAVAR